MRRDPGAGDDADWRARLLAVTAVTLPTWVVYATLFAVLPASEAC